MIKCCQSFTFFYPRMHVRYMKQGLKIRNKRIYYMLSGVLNTSKYKLLA
jgi:hypothetical protein